MVTALTRDDHDNDNDDDGDDDKDNYEDDDAKILSSHQYCIVWHGRQPIFQNGSVPISVIKIT